jgi:hypothetical protein
MSVLCIYQHNVTALESFLSIQCFLKIYIGKTQGRNHLGDLSKDGRIILQYILEK